MNPNGLWYGIQMPVIKDEPITEDNSVKVYYFGWEENGKKRGYGRPFKTLEGAVVAADAHRKRTGKTSYHVVGRAVAGFAF